MLPKIREVLEEAPVLKAWVCGSFSRNEDRPDSDVDILVVYDPLARVTLMTVGHLHYQLTNTIGRQVDILEEQALRPHLKEAIDKDKILIYERKNS